MGERVEIKNISDALKYLGDSELEKVFEFYKKDFGKEINFSGIYLTKKELFCDIQSRIVDFLNDSFRELKSKVSKLRKRGFDVDCVDFNLLRVPLKTKIFVADTNSKNYGEVKEILNSVEQEILKFPDENDAFFADKVNK